MVKKLEEEGRITVIVDDRGKLILLTEEELKAVADVMKREGRVSLSKLTKLCGSIIRMNGAEWCVC